MALVGLWSAPGVKQRIGNCAWFLVLLLVLPGVAHDVPALDRMFFWFFLEKATGPASKDVVAHCLTETRCRTAMAVLAFWRR